MDLNKNKHRQKGQERTKVQITDRINRYTALEVVFNKEKGAEHVRIENVLIVIL